MAPQATRILVTGGAGFLGGHLVKALVEAGHSVRVLDDFSTGTRERLDGLPIDLLEGDVRSGSAVAEAMDGVELVFHLAGVRVGNRVPRDEVLLAETVNVGGALNVLAAAAARDTRRVVLAGSGSVYGGGCNYVLHEDLPPQPATIHAIQQRAVEQYARLYHQMRGVGSVVLRLFRCYGPGERWSDERAALVPRLCRAAVEGHSPTFFGDGRQTRDLVYADDAVAAFIAAGWAGAVDGNVYNIASGEPVSVAHVWEVIARLAGYRSDAPLPRHLPALAWEPPYVKVSLARARRDLGYAPRHTLRQGLERTLEHYRSLWRGQEHGWFTPSDDSIALAAAPPRARVEERPRPGIPWRMPVSGLLRTDGTTTMPHAPTPVSNDTAPRPRTPPPMFPPPFAGAEDDDDELEIVIELQPDDPEDAPLPPLRERSA
jgi:UDP-glucose 4-epimerase